MLNKFLFSLLAILLGSSIARGTNIELNEFFSQITIEELLSLQVGDLLTENVKNKTNIEEVLINRETRHVLQRTNSNSDPEIEMGVTFNVNEPWSLLAAKAIKIVFEKNQGERVNVGDWGCGYGNTSGLLLLAGANLKAFDLIKEAAEDANRYLKRLVDLSEIREGNSWPYTVGNYAVENPPPIFLARKNQINVCLNVIHFLTPDQVEKLLKNLYLNTVDDGYIILSGAAVPEELNDILDTEGGNDYIGYKSYQTYWAFNPSTGSSVSCESIGPVTDENKATIHRPKQTKISKNAFPFAHVPKSRQKELSSAKEFFTQERVMNSLTKKILQRILPRHGFSMINYWKHGGMIFVVAQKLQAPSSLVEQEISPNW